MKIINCTFLQNPDHVQSAGAPAAAPTASTAALAILYRNQAVMETTGDFHVGGNDAFFTFQ